MFTSLTVAIDMKNPFNPEFVQPRVAALNNFPKVKLGHYPTPLEYLPRISQRTAPSHVYVKRDDCTGLGLGGNKVRQLEYYLGDALTKGCDTVLSTGAIQSNYMRTLAAASSKLGLDCHIQLEDRVPGKPETYHKSGNKLLTEMFGAKISYFPEGEDEEAADIEIRRIATELEGQGRKPYVVPLKPVRKPKGAMGYIDAAHELIEQLEQQSIEADLVVVGSGSGLTHCGLLFGLRLLGQQVPVLGVCVRREASFQGPRVLSHCRNLEKMIGIDAVVKEEDVWVDDNALAPGYGLMSKRVGEAIGFAASSEGLLLDPVYSGKTMACMLALADNGQLTDFQNIVFIHTGGAPTIFAYQEDMHTITA
jgi:D-cysteine desulfhydrase/L-cysteate sulfo-lyase